MGNSDKKVLVICGPTASGKTGIGIEIARRIKGEIISADARQFYKLMDIGTAKPTLEERAQVPHYLVDFADINDHITAADFRDLALKYIDVIFGHGCRPIVVGGSGLYIKALEEGFFEGPKADPKYRVFLEYKIEKDGIESLYRKLQKIDPETAHRLNSRDKSRIIRALEVCNSTGISISTMQNEGKYSQNDYEYVKVGLKWPREKLYNRINTRVRQMVEMGLLNEVKVVHENLSRHSSHLFKSLGYREFKAHLDGKYDLERAIFLTQMRTRQYAKRQMTWFKSDQSIVWFDAEASDLAENIVSYFTERLGEG